MIVPVEIAPLARALEHLSIRPESVRTLGAAGGGPLHFLVGIPATEPDVVKAAAEACERARTKTSPDGALLLLLEGSRDDAAIARVRDSLWPFAHVGTLIRLSDRGVDVEKLQGRTRISDHGSLRGTLLVAYRRERVLAPDTTVAKFDQNAAGWSGVPGKPGYAHFRWMRKYVATFTPLDGVKRILDFGCGAGWVGIEAALAAPGAELCAFDPSPAMIELARENARASGIGRFTARTGFGEEPPFPARGEAPFDLVISSGVISFAPDSERWLDGLARTVAGGGRLVIGDANRESIGMRRRRERKPLLPVRELNAKTREEVRAALERRGFAFEAWAGYQLTYPVPELMDWSARRLGGALDRPLLAWNRMRSGAADGPERFDSWVMRLRRG